MPNKAPDLNEYSNFLKSVPDFADTFVELLRTHWSGWVLLLILVIWVLLNKRSREIFNLAEKRKKERITSYESYLGNKDFIDDEVAEVIKDQHASHFFRKATNIVAEKSLRSNLIRLHKLISYCVDWVQIRRALPFIEFSHSGEVNVKEFSASDKISYGYNIFVGTIFLLFAGIVFIVFVFSGSKSLASV